jgi:hypothetical protein
VRGDGRTGDSESAFSRKLNLKSDPIPVDDKIYLRILIFDQANFDVRGPLLPHQVMKIPTMITAMAIMDERMGISPNTATPRSVAKTGSARISVDNKVAEINLTA